MTEITGARQLTVQPPHCPICNASTLRFPYYIIFQGMTEPTQICKSCYRIMGCIEYMKIRGAYKVVTND